jgi:hypothetical protein
MHARKLWCEITLNLEMSWYVIFHKPLKYCNILSTCFHEVLYSYHLWISILLLYMWNLCLLIFQNFNEVAHVFVVCSFISTYLCMLVFMPGFLFILFLWEQSVTGMVCSVWCACGLYRMVQEISKVILLKLDSYRVVHSSWQRFLCITLNFLFIFCR